MLGRDKCGWATNTMAVLALSLVDTNKSSTIDSRIKAGNLEVIKPGEEPIVLALEPIMVALILTSSVSGKPLRVKEAIALCNEVLQSHDEMKAKVIAWKQGRGIHNPNRWLL